MPRMQTTAFLLSLATLCVPALAQDTNQAVRDPSSISALNFVHGQATLDGQPVTADGTNSPQQLHAGDALATTQGSADVMLAPGALLRIGSGARVEFVADSPARAEIRLQSGRANVSVNHVPADTLLLVDMPNGQTQLLKSGLYTFDTGSDTVRVYHGEADAFAGEGANGSEKPVKVKHGHELVLNEGFKPEKFDEDENLDLLPWTGPQETEAAMADGAVSDHGFASVGYGYGGFGDSFAYGGYPYGGYFGGIDYPYGYGYPYGFYGYPFFGFGVGYFGGGFYGGRVGYGYGYHGGYGYHHGYGGVHGGYPGGYHGSGIHVGGYSGGEFHGGGGFHGNGFSGGGFHGGGFSGGGLHGGGGFGGRR